MADTEPPVEIEYKGTTYKRRPDAEQRSHRVYYWPAGGGKSDKEALHREIWKDHNGEEIPDGHLIHHKDKDPFNNDPENLECITWKEHAEEHEAELEWDGMEEHLDEIRPLAIEWHRSEEGREWHREHGKKVWENREPRTLVCEYCGEDYETLSRHGNERFCSSVCRSRWWEENRSDFEERECKVCGDTFEVRRDKDQPHCSRECAWVTRRREG